MSNMFKSAHSRVRNSPYAIFFFLIFVAMFVISLITGLEDIRTSYFGYLMFPTRKSLDIVPYAVALIPLVAQIGFFYVFLSNTNRKWAIWLALLLHLVDITYDVYFKASGQPWHVWLIAFVESEAIYTGGSEIMFTVSFGMIIELLPDFMKQTGLFLSRVLSGTESRHSSNRRRQSSKKHNEQHKKRRKSRDLGAQFNYQKDRGPEKPEPPKRPQAGSHRMLRGRKRGDTRDRR